MLFLQAFPRGSPLTSEISRGILELASNGRMDELEKQLYGHRSCPDKDDSQTSSSLTSRSFLGLFVITGTSSLLALISHVIATLYDHRGHWINGGSQISWRELLAVLFKIFHERDSSNTPDKEEPGMEGIYPTTAETPCSMSTHIIKNADSGTDMVSTSDDQKKKLHAIESGS